MKDTPLQVGLQAIDTITQPGDDKTQLVCAKCRALLKGYATRWSDEIYRPISVEQVISARIINPATGAKSRTLTTAGKEDVVATRYSVLAGSNKIIVLDHKTTSDDITDSAGPYWRQLIIESQPSHYMLLEWLNGRKVDEACWDVVHKPTINPRQLKTKAERALVVANRTYCNVRISDATIEWLTANDRENLELYEARLLHDCTIERPQVYFQRRTVARLDSELMEYAADLWDAGQLIIEARRKNRWPRHPGSCMNYNTPCSFLGICSGQDTPDSANWQKRASVHEELLTGDQFFDINTLTNSSIRCFQSCPRKFFYRYYEGIERVNEEEKEALFFGHIWHLGLEAYWKALLPQENNDGSSRPSGDNSTTAHCESVVPF